MMCGRYLLRNSPAEATHSPWRDYWDDINQFVPRYNIAPSQSSWVLIANEESYEWKSMTWGFRPSWAKASFTKINARSETCFDSKMFSESAKQKRCLILADGFYEPKGAATKQGRPWHVFQRSDLNVFAMAGLWTRFQSSTESYENFSILTTEGKGIVAPIHDRMPLIVNEDDWKIWLSDLTVDDVKSLMMRQQYPEMTQFEVADTVKKAGVEGEACIQPNQAPVNLSLF